MLVQDDPTISWSSTNKVTWDDFKAPTKQHEDVIAVTASGLSFHYSTKRYSTGRIEYNFDVTAHFYPEKSWYVKAHVTDITLAHERLHFDITELHARKFRKMVESTNFSNNIDAEMDAINIKLNEALSKMQHKYDLETNHSRNGDKQVVWQNFIKEELQKMKPYSE